MTKSDKARAIQTEVKHIILRKYIGSWGGIILQGISNKRGKEAQFVYVDANAYRGRYPGDQSDEIDFIQSGVVYGSPVIGIEAFDELVVFAQKKYSIRLYVSAILIEKETPIFNDLISTLSQKGYGDRIEINPNNLFGLRNQQIALFNADSIEIMDQINQYTSTGKKFTFAFLDPYGASGIPLHNYVDSITRLERHDVIINFPYLDLHRKTGLVKKKELSLDLDQRQRLQDCDRMFGHNRWRTLADDMDKEKDNDRSIQLEQKLVDCYRDSLHGVDPGLAVKSIRMRFPKRERSMYYLFLTTHDPTGALEINRILWDAKLLENELRWQLREKRFAEKGQLPLFNSPAPPSPDQPEERPSKEECADHIYKVFSGRQLILRELFREMVDEQYFAREIKAALSLLNKRGYLSYTGKLTNDSKLMFN